MAEPSTIARPYAEAVFRLADASGKRANWSTMLGDLAGVAADARIGEAIDSPNVPAAKIAGMFIGVLAGRLDGEAENLVRVLAENDRLKFLPEIASQYEALRNAREGVVEAQITTAFALDDVQLLELVAALEAKTGKRVKTNVAIDKALIAGVRVALGDKVIDASARAQLASLEAALKR
jgi:F-type H+-transporting ATPase subunit delta